MIENLKYIFRYYRLLISVQKSQIFIINNYYIYYFILLGLLIIFNINCYVIFNDDMYLYFICN